MTTLLVIEDELALAKNIARYFEKLNHKVAVAHAGRSGIELAGALMPDVVIVDFQLPGMDGLEVIRALRRIDKQVRTVMERALTDSGAPPAAAARSGAVNSGCTWMRAAFF